MERCDYCGRSFEAEGAYLDHLESNHGDDLGPIDRRRIEARRGGSGGRSLVVPLAIAAIAIACLGLLAGVYVVFGGSSDPTPSVDAEREPTNLGDVHIHGTFEGEIAGDPLDVANDQRLIDQDQYFHFHGGSDLWHVHGEDVTLEYALATLGIELEDGGDRLTFDGETYDDTDAETNVSVTVDGEAVDPATYVLQGVGPEDQAADGAGDDIQVVVERAT
ncbi:MAG: hypothetical protein ACLFMX_04805 [Halobacteriales archaeon]